MPLCHQLLAAPLSERLRAELGVTVPATRPGAFCAHRSVVDERCRRIRMKSIETEDDQ